MTHSKRLKLLNYANMFFAGANAACVIWNCMEGHSWNAILNMTIMFANILAACWETNNG